MRAGRARSGSGFVWPLSPVSHRDLPGSKIDDRRRNEKRRDLARPAFDQGGVLAFDNVESADARSDVYAHPLLVLGLNLEAGHMESFVGCGDGEMDEAPHLLDFFFLNVLKRIEVLDLGGDLACEVARVKASNPPYARLPGQ